MPISNRAGGPWCGLFEQRNHHQQDVDLSLQSHVQAKDEGMSSGRFSSHIKIAPHEIKNEMHDYHILILQSGSPDIYIRAVPDGQTVTKDWSTVLKRLKIVHIPWKWPHYCNGEGSCITIMCALTQGNMLAISWPRIVWKWFLTLFTAETSHPVIFPTSYAWFTFSSRQHNTRTRLWRVHSSCLSYSWPVLVSSWSSRKHVGKSVPSQRNENVSNVSPRYQRYCDIFSFSSWI